MTMNFELKLDTLNKAVADMGALVVESIGDSMRALMDMDKDLAQKNMEFDHEIDQKMKEIESLCLKLLLFQQPVAKDMRFISATLKMVNDLERIGDQCADISSIVINLEKSGRENPLKKLRSIAPMEESVKYMVSKSVASFVFQDVFQAEKVIEKDDVLDKLFHESKKDLVEFIRNGDPIAESAIDSFMVSKYLERIGDHAVNVAKWAIFSVTGNHSGVSLFGAAEIEEK